MKKIDSYKTDCIKILKISPIIQYLPFMMIPSGNSAITLIRSATSVPSHEFRLEFDIIPKK
jgi:hypothetical protein